MSLNDSNYLKDLFIDEALKALQVSRGGGSSSDDTQTYILVDESGNEVPAVMVAKETVFNATANDIREGVVAATDSGVTVGTKEIPAYYVTEGIQAVPSGNDFRIPLNSRYDYTKLQAIICPINTTITDSVLAEKVVIDDHVYLNNSVESLSNVSVDYDDKAIALGITNDTDKLYLIRYFTYKEEY